MIHPTGSAHHLRLQAKSAHQPDDHEHPEPSEDGPYRDYNMARVAGARGMCAELPSPGACFFFEEPHPSDPDYVAQRLYLTLPRTDKPGWWAPNYCWIGTGPDCHQWDGRVDYPTITPSILEADTGTDAPRWHGYLTKGVLRPC